MLLIAYLIYWIVGIVAAAYILWVVCYMFYLLVSLVKKIIKNTLKGIK
jgi:hypothetical protein